MKLWKDGGAGFDATGKYRYLLWRTWDASAPRLLWVMLNPSTADAQDDDTTVSRCIAFSKRDDFGGIEIVNLFAYITTYPQKLPEATDPKAMDPIGSENDRYIAKAAKRVDKIAVAWGENGALYQQRVDAVLKLLTPYAQSSESSLQCLGQTRNGCPRHPLYLAPNTPFEPYAP